MSIKADLNELTSVNDYQKIASKFKNLDIAILICNAGVATMGRFSDLNDEEVEKCFNVKGC